MGWLCACLPSQNNSWGPEIEIATIWKPGGISAGLGDSLPIIRILPASTAEEKECGGGSPDDDVTMCILEILVLASPLAGFPRGS